MKKSMICSLAAFSDDFGKLFLRLALAFTLIPHGAQKVFGIFEGNGLQATWQYFTEVLQITPLWAGTAIAVEFLGPIFLILGIFTRVWAVLLAVLMAVAMQFHFDNGYFLNWTGNQLGEGIEFHLLYIGAAIALVLLGGGRFAFLRLCKCDACNCDVPEEPKTESSKTE